MRSLRFGSPIGSLVLGVLTTFAAPLAAHPYPPPPPGIREATANLVGVTIEIDGEAAPLYRAPDGSGRWYLEARQGARYAVRLANRTGGRLGVALLVDGLHSISGERFPTPKPGASDPGRLYILDPWDSTTIRGWRTSLEDVQSFTFVDERGSYAARSGKANRRMGWIEVLVYRERGRIVSQPRPWDPRLRRPQRGDAPSGAEPQAEKREEPALEDKAQPYDEAGKDDTAARAAAPPRAANRDRSEGEAAGSSRPAPRSFPGTGWGPRAHDPVVVVEFEPEPAAAEQVTLRYEYRPALQALGILPRPVPNRDRLWERERGDGFAKPPAW